MKFTELEMVCLLNDHPKENLKTGNIGVVVMAYTNPNEAYEIEFVDINGKTKTQITLLANEIEKYHAGDVNSVLGSRSPFPEQMECIIPGGINSSQIKGAWVIKKGVPTGEFIPNPKFIGDK